MASPTMASLYTHTARHCDPVDCDQHDRARLHRTERDQPWWPQLRQPKPRNRRIVGPMDNDRRADRYLAQNGRSRLTVRQMRQMRRMGRRQIPRPR